MGIAARTGAADTGADVRRAVGAAAAGASAFRKAASKKAFCAAARGLLTAWIGWAGVNERDIGGRAKANP